jgi:hypothetical protein
MEITAIPGGVAGGGEDDPLLSGDVLVYISYPSHLVAASMKAKMS